MKISLRRLISIAAIAAVIGCGQARAQTFADYEVVEHFQELKLEPGGLSGDVKVSCPQGKRVIGGGGGLFARSPVYGVRVFWSGPFDDSNGSGWVAGFVNETFNKVNAEAYIKAICARLK
jgi:hypothetical protein